MRAGGILTLLLLAAQAEGQKPIRIDGKCTMDAVQALNLPCTEQEPCPLYLELAGVEAVGPRLVLTGNIHTGAATLESVLLVSDDVGRTWTEPSARIAAAVLDQIQFLDFEAGWINGHVLSGGPRDAFFLLTTDGGQTWRRRPVFEENRTGAVEQFWFESRSSGTMALDRVRAAENGMRYELWESRTGGESWSIRQVDSRPVQFRKPSREPLVRIVPDKTGKTNRIERREGNGWVVISAFDVSAGTCKPQLPPLAPPPEPEPPPSTPVKP